MPLCVSFYKQEMAGTENKPCAQTAVKNPIKIAYKVDTNTDTNRNMTSRKQK